MMKIKYFFPVLIVLISINSVVSANVSDTSKKVTLNPANKDFSNYFFNDFILNPAFIGINGGMNLMIKGDVDKPLGADNFNGFMMPHSLSILFDDAFGKKRNFAAGVYFNSEMGGTFYNTTAGLSASKTFDLFKDTTSSFYNKLKIGVSVIYNTIFYSNANASFGDMIDPRWGFMYNTSEIDSSKSFRFVNVSAGVSYHNPYFYCGFAVHDIPQHSITIIDLASKIPIEFDISLGGNIKLCNNFSLHPSFNIYILHGFKGRLNSYTPAVICSYKNTYDAGISYMDLNKIGIYAGGVLFKHLTLLACCAFSVNNELYQFGTLSYIGGKIMYDFKK